ncbi:MAG: hypothetical protein IPM21_01065 [Acidobacteria bacterium]|nr:hypothetical protein [Acidobacteriota bacterium]
MKNILPITLVLVAVVGCKMFGTGNVVPNEQINADLSGKSVNITEGSYGGDNKFTFREDYDRCFVVNEKESQISDSQATLSLTVTSWGSLNMKDLGLDEVYNTVFGKLTMQYKKEGEKWVLQKLETKELMYKSLETEQWKKFLDIAMPTCAKGFRHQGS